jgi:23S rRNA pseudouridine1911/1915/1917 synthase
VTSRIGSTGAEHGPRLASSPVAGRLAETELAILERFERGLLVEARPLTGRKHQVRVHLAEAGLPILGDARYGGPTEVAGFAVERPMLHARRLVLPHPVSGSEIAIESAQPADFARVLDALRGFTRGASFA